MIEDITNLIIEEFLNKQKSKRENAEVQIPLELPLDIPYWPENFEDRGFDENESDKKENDYDIYKGNDIIIIQMKY